MNIAGVEIGQPHPCRIVAEIGANHNGSLEVARRLVHECPAAGADFVKFQCYTLPEILALRGDGPTPEPWRSLGYETLPELYRKAITPHEWFPALVTTAKDAGVPWFSSVFGPDSARLLESLGCPAIKISAWDEHSFNFHKRDASVPIIASTRGYHRCEWADLTLWCPPGYPQGWVTSGDFVARYTLHDGLSYHGTNEMIPAHAAEQGAQMVEVHVQLDDEPAELDGHSSLTVAQLERLCEAVRQVAA